MQTTELYRKFDNIESRYIFVELHDIVNNNAFGLFITVEEKTIKEKLTDYRKFIIYFNGFDFFSYRVLYEPMGLLYKKLLLKNNNKFECEKISFIEQSLYLDIFYQENPVFDEKNKVSVAYLPLGNNVIEVLGPHKPFIIICLGDNIVYGEENFYE